MVQVHDMLVLEDDMVQVHGMKVWEGEVLKAAELQTEYGAFQEREVACNLDPSVEVCSQSPWPCCGGDGHHEAELCSQSPWPCCDGDGHHEEELCSQCPWPCCDDDGGRGHCPDGPDVLSDGGRAGHSPASGAPA